MQAIGFLKSGFLYEAHYFIDSHHEASLHTIYYFDSKQIWNIFKQIRQNLTCNSCKISLWNSS